MVTSLLRLGASRQAKRLARAQWPSPSMMALPCPVVYRAPLTSTRMDVAKFLQLETHRSLAHAVATLTDLLMTTKTQLAADLAGVAEQVTKIGAETRTLLSKIDALATQLATADQIGDEAEAALAALKDQARVVDELVPDEPAQG
ncbi:MAG: hypothetical protein LCI02_05020 [Proteobacteria bacterium]|nr:hypothetical protein [Pseudomonadota bacterium]